MGYCVMCGSVIPDEQTCCSMCYGDPSYGSDGYYEQWLRDQERERQEKEAAKPQKGTM